MGMFDYLEFEEPLPDLPVNVVTTGRGCPQTKSFDFPCLDHYVIRSDKLYRQVRHYRGTGKFVEDELLGPREIKEVESVEEEYVPYHGDIDISCDLTDEDAKLVGSSWIRLVLRFTNGELEWIRTEDEYDKWMAEKAEEGGSYDNLS